jgi:hypothetical protein
VPSLRNAFCNNHLLAISNLSQILIFHNFQIRPKSLDTDFLAASEHILTDLPDPVMISGESGSNLSTLSKSSDLSLSDITVEQKVSPSDTELQCFLN